MLKPFAMQAIQNAGQAAASAGSSVVPDHGHLGSAGDGGQIDHGAALTGLADDDHTQYLTTARHLAIGDGSPHHAALTLADAATQAILSLSTQALTFDNQNANLVLAGPASGVATQPTFRALTAADMTAFGSGTAGQIAYWTGAGPATVTGNAGLTYAAGGALTITGAAGNQLVAGPAGNQMSLAVSATGQVTLDANGAGALFLLSDVLRLVALPHTSVGTSNGVLQAVSESISIGCIETFRYGNTAAGGAYTAYKARGTISSPAVVQAGDVLGGWNGVGWDGAAWQYAARERALVESVTGGHVYSLIELVTYGADGLVQRGVIASTGATWFASSTLPQMSFRYDASNRLDVSITSGGAITLDAVGASAGFTLSDSVGISGTLTSTSTAAIQFSTRYDSSNRLDVSVSVAGAVAFDAVGASAAFTFSDGVQVISGGMSVGTTLHASAYVYVLAPAAAGAAEEVLRCTVSDDAGSYFDVFNGSVTDNVFIPRVRGIQSSTYTALSLLGAGTTDTGTNPVMEFNSRIGASTLVVTRPLFRWLNHTTAYAYIWANAILEMENVQILAAGADDGYCASARFDPGYSGAYTIARHNYLDIQDVSLASGAAVTDACVMRFDANAGTHKALDTASTKTTPGGVDAWVKINLNGTLGYVPVYLSKTA